MLCCDRCSDYRLAARLRTPIVFVDLGVWSSGSFRRNREIAWRLASDFRRSLFKFFSFLINVDNVFSLPLFPFITESFANFLFISSHSTAIFQSISATIFRSISSRSAAAFRFVSSCSNAAFYSIFRRFAAAFRSISSRSAEAS